MNKPAPIEPKGGDDDPGPVDANGQQILSPAEEEALDRVRRDPAYLAGIERGMEDVRAGRMVDHEEALAQRAEQRRQYLAERTR
jgi:hypothetical protein